MTKLKKKKNVKQMKFLFDELVVPKHDSGRGRKFCEFQKSGESFGGEASPSECTTATCAVHK